MEIGSTSSFLGSQANAAIRAETTLQDRPVEADAAHDAALFTAALRAAQSAPDLRAEKVAALRAQVAAGAYDLDIKTIAKALIRDDLDLF